MLINIGKDKKQLFAILNIDSLPNCSELKNSLFKRQAWLSRGTWTT
ncbi:MAG: hypothetical protein ACOC35_16735 [Promethearchaeia archaeon]